MLVFTLDFQEANSYNVPANSSVTLDYRSWDLTGYQTPQDLYVYVDDIRKTSQFLKLSNFSEGTRGHVVLLEKQPSAENSIQQVYLDCIAKGGRSVLDAIALEIRYVVTRIDNRS